MMKAQHASSFMRRPGRGAVSAAALALGLLAAPALAAATAAGVTISHPWMRFLTAQNSRRRLFHAEQWQRPARHTDRGGVAGLRPTDAAP